MTVKSRPTTAQEYMPRMNGRKVAGWIAAVFSYITTLWCVQALGGEGFMAYGIAFGLELFLFMAKGLVFNSRRQDDALGWIAIAVDTLLNAGGMWNYILRVDETPAYKMIAVAFDMQPQIAKVWALVLSLVLGYLLSYGPHRLLRDD